MATRSRYLLVGKKDQPGIYSQLVRVKIHWGPASPSPDAETQESAGCQRRRLPEERGNPHLSWCGGFCGRFKLLGYFVQADQAISIPLFAEDRMVFPNRQGEGGVDDWGCPCS